MSMSLSLSQSRLFVSISAGQYSPCSEYESEYESESESEYESESESESKSEYFQIHSFQGRASCIRAHACISTESFFLLFQWN